MPEMARLGLTLFFLCLVATAALSYTYEQTTPIIARNRTAAAEAARRAVLAGADVVQEDPRLAIEVAPEDVVKLRSVLNDEQERSKLVRVFRGTKGGATVGWAVELAAKGFSGDIALIVGATQEPSGRLVVAGTRVVKLTETPGLGTELAAVAYEDAVRDGERAVPRFQQQFLGKGLDQLHLRKDDPRAGTVDALTAATVSSRAFTNGVCAGLDLLTRRLAVAGALEGSRSGL